MEDKLKNIQIIESGQTKKLILNRPEKRNSLDEEMIYEITDAMNKFSSDKDQIDYNYRSRRKFLFGNESRISSQNFGI